jgi:transketolase
MRTAFINELMSIAATDNRIVLVTGDLGFSVLERFAERFPDRYINVGVAEQNMIGIASGLALSGKIVFTYSIANFATIRCLEQIRNDVCYHHANVKIVSVGAGFSYATQGYTHFGIEDIAIMRALPNIKVLSPADPLETSLIVKQAVANDGPCYLRLGKANEARIHSENFIFDPSLLPIIIPVITRDSKVNILATGAITAMVKDKISSNNLNYSLWSVPHIKPIDDIALLKIATNSDFIYTIEEHQLSGGFGSAVLEAYERLVNQGRLTKFPVIKRMGVNDLIPDYIGSQSFMRELITIP